MPFEPGLLAAVTKWVNLQIDSAQRHCAHDSVISTLAALAIQWVLSMQTRWRVFLQDESSQFLQHCKVSLQRMQDLVKI